MASFHFDLSRLDAHDGKDAMNEVTLDAAQRKLVQDLGDLVGAALGIDSIPCRGLWLQAVRRWQKLNQRHATHITSLTPPERLKAAFEIKDHFVQLVSSMLVNPHQLGAVQSTIDAAHAMYLAKYNRR